MSQRAVEGVLGRLITDSDFRSRFYREPAVACQEEAFELTTRELAAVLRLEEAHIRRVAMLLDAQIMRAPRPAPVERATAATARSARR